MDLDIVSVLTYYYPGALWEYNGKGYDGLTWLDSTPKPTLAELSKLNDKAKALNVCLAKRRTAYPPLEDQLDALWQGGDTMEFMRKKIAEVKAKYPKPQ